MWVYTYCGHCYCEEENLRRRRGGGEREGMKIEDMKVEGCVWWVITNYPVCHVSSECAGSSPSSR